MIRSVLGIMTVCCSLNLLANEDEGSDYTTVNGWEDQSAEDSFEDRFNPSGMFSDEEEEIDNGTEYNRFKSPYDDYGYDDGSDRYGDDSEIYEVPDESDEQSEPDYYEEE